VLQSASSSQLFSQVSAPLQERSQPEVQSMMRHSVAPVQLRSQLLPVQLTTQLSVPPHDMSQLPPEHSCVQDSASVQL
jgi:hypothetical protein